MTFLIHLLQRNIFNCKCTVCLYTLIPVYICRSGHGGPQPPLLSPLTPLPSPSPPPPPLPSPSSPTSLPLEYFSRPHRKNNNKKNNRSSHHITFHFSAWIIIKALRLQDSLFVCSSVHLLVCCGVLQPSQRPSRQHCSQAKPCLRRNGKDNGRQDR